MTGVALAGALSCAGVRSPAWTVQPSGTAMDAAGARVIQAVDRGQSASETAVSMMVAHRLGATNELSAAIVSAVQALRMAAPTTRALDPTAAADARQRLMIADAHFDAAERAPFRMSYAQRRYLYAAARVLDAADTTLNLCSDARCVDADVAYAALFERYDDFRDGAAALAEAATIDPTGTWLRPVQPTARDAFSPEASVFIDRGRELRTLARLDQSTNAEACLEALQPLPNEGALPDACQAWVQRVAEPVDPGTESP